MPTHQQSEPNAQPASEKRITEGVRDMLAILEDPAATEDEKSMAASTIVDAVAPDIMEAATREAREWWDGKPPASEPSGKEESLNSLEARLAADIRAIDGNHDKGAAELAEQLIARGWLSQAARLEASHAALQSKLDAVAGLVEKWRATSEASERRACIGHFPEGYSAESRAYENCADELAASLAE
jgi:hypothetical protein